MPYPPLRGYFGGTAQIFDLSRAIPAKGRDNFAEGKVTFPLTWGSIGYREAGALSRQTVIHRAAKSLPLQGKVAHGIAA